MKQRKKPALRFKGFVNDWEQRKLGDIVDFLDTQRKPLTENIREKGPYPYYGASGIVDYVAGYIFDEELVLLSEDGANITDRNYPVCFLASGKYWVNNHAHVLKTKEGIDNNFICNSLECKDFSIYNTGMAMPKLNQDICKKIPVDFPTYDEQEKIGNYFRNIDYFITLHQRKLEKLQNLKKAMLEKMFPKNGAKVPEIRFKGFTDDWEQRKLGECCQEFKSGSFISASDIGDVGKYPVYGGNGLRGFSAEYNHDGEFALIGRQGALCGNMNYSVGRAYFTEHAIAVQANKTADTKFLYYLLRKMNLGQYSDQSAQPGLAVGKLVKLTDLFPSVAEQIKIGHQFMGIDNLITLHQRKLEKLQNLKKAMLEKMFI